MNWTIKEPSQDQHGKLNEFLESNITGFDAVTAQILARVGQQQAEPILPRSMVGIPYSSIWRVANFDNNTLAGVINSSVPYEMAIDAANIISIHHGRGFARERRIISGIAVQKDARGRGIGKALLQENETAAKRQGASVVVGFMDDANGSPQFYRSAGYTVMPHNEPLPKSIGNFGLNERHDSGLNGHWFYKEI